MNPILLKLTFISGLKEIVLAELLQYPKIKIVNYQEDSVFIAFTNDFETLRKLRSITNIYVVKTQNDLNPYFISRHKSVLGELIDIVLKKSHDTFNTFTISCAGSDSAEVKEIKKYITITYKLTESDAADLEIFIGKSSSFWEVGVRIMARPLSLRDYKVEHLVGGLNPTIAYTMNSFCGLESKESYLNIFSGSATLLIEAGLSNKELSLVGFDIDGKRNALAVKNIKKAGLIKSIQLKTADIFNMPDFGMFDVITSDLPFGMQISKDEDLEKLYGCFIEYAQQYLKPQGTLVLYTTEHEMLERLLKASACIITKTLTLKVSTVTGIYINPKIFVCTFS